MFKEIIKKFNKTTILKDYNFNTVGITFKDNILFVSIAIRDTGLVNYNYKYELSNQVGDAPDDFTNNIKLSDFMGLVLKSNTLDYKFICSLKDIDFYDCNIVNPLDASKGIIIDYFKSELDSFISFTDSKKLNQECRFYLDGIHIKIDKDFINMTMCNGHILITKRFINTNTIINNGVSELELLIRSPHLKILQKNIKKDSEIFFNVDNDKVNIILKDKDFNIITIISDNLKYVEFEKVFKNYSTENFIDLERDKLINSNTVKETRDYPSKKMIKLKYITELDKWFNSHYLDLVYNSIKGDIIRINIGKAGEVFFYKDNIRMALMSARF